MTTTTIKFNFVKPAVRDYSNYPSRTVIYPESVPFIHCYTCGKCYTTDARQVHYDKNGNHTITYKAVTDYIRSDGYGHNLCVDTHTCVKK